MEIFASQATLLAISMGARFMAITVIQLSNTLKKAFDKAIANH